MTTPTPRPASWRRIVEAKRAHPTWGPKKLIAWLRRRDAHGPLPAPRAASWTARGLCSGDVAAAGPLERALRPRHRAQRRVVHRLQRLVPHRRRDARRSPHRAGRGLSLPHRLPWAGAPHRPGDTARVSARLPGVRPPPGHPDRQRPALRRRRPGQPLTPLRMVDQARDRPRAHRAGTPRTERASRAPSPHPQGGDGVAAQGQRRRQRQAFDHFGTATTTSDPTRPWDSDRRSGSTPPRSGPIPHASTRRTTGPRSPCAECATTARSSGRGTESM